MKANPPGNLGQKVGTHDSHLMIMTKNTKRGFTLIEILVVVTIIGILASITLLGLGSARKSAQDTKRITDLRAVQSALEVHFSRNNGTYPDGTLALDMAGAIGQYGELPTELAPVIGTSRVPNDTQFPYGYQTDATDTSYYLCGVLTVSSRPANNVPPPAALAGVKGYYDRLDVVSIGATTFCFTNP